MGCTFLSRGDSWPRDARAEHDDSQDTLQHVVSLLNMPTTARRGGNPRHPDRLQGGDLAQRGR
jgi:hypothetical protein